MARRGSVLFTVAALPFILICVVVSLWGGGFGGRGLVQVSGDLAEKAEQKKNNDTLYDFNNVDIPDWQTYRNEGLGFEIKYPPISEYAGSGCRKSDGSYVANPEPVPLAVFEKPEKNAGYIASKYAYTYNENTQKCGRSPQTIENLDRMNNLSFWKIYVETVNNEQELNEFIQGLGEGCVLEELKESIQDGVYDVVLDDTAKQKPNYQPFEECFPVYINHVLKYAPEKNKVVFLGIGHGWNYTNSINSSYGFKIFNEHMIESFKFL